VGPEAAYCAHDSSIASFELLSAAYTFLVIRHTDFSSAAPVNKRPAATVLRILEFFSINQFRLTVYVYGAKGTDLLSPGLAVTLSPDG
jgi:hypothetical protein